MQGKSFYIFFVCIFSLFFSSVTFAQTVPASVGGLDLSMSSSNPVPGQTITVTVRSYVEDIRGSTVVWIVEGKERRRGHGADTVEVTAPALGKKVAVGVVVIAPSGKQLAESITIGSGSVDLILESDGYVPPLFLGKISPVFENNVKIVAIPHLANSAGVEYDPKTLIYEWQRNDRAISDQSGYGKNSVIVEGGIVPRPYTISVTARTRDNSAATTGYISVSPQAASLLLYIDDPLYGPLFNKSASSNINLGRQRESSILAVPYGFNKPVEGAGNLSYLWTVNGSLREDLAKNQSIVLRAPEEEGRSSIELQIKHNLNILQEAATSFTASFSKPDERSLISF